MIRHCQTVQKKSEQFEITLSFLPEIHWICKVCAFVNECLMAGNKVVIIGFANLKLFAQQNFSNSACAQLIKATHLSLCNPFA